MLNITAKLELDVSFCSFEFRWLSTEFSDHFQFYINPKYFWTNAEYIKLILEPFYLGALYVA